MSAETSRYKDIVLSLRYWADDSRRKKEYRDMMSAAADALDEAIRTIDARGVPAKWIPFDDDRDPDYRVRYYRCPLCGIANFWQTRFCPNCGHKMCPTVE